MHKPITIIPAGAKQWNINIIDLYNKSGKSIRAIAEEIDAAEKSVQNVIFCKSKNPGIELVTRIIHAIGGKSNEVFGETGAVIADSSTAELQAEVDRLTKELEELKEERTELMASNTELRTKAAELRDKVDELKDELLSIYRGKK